MSVAYILTSAEATLLLSIAALYIVHCPFTKVEESFNIQAIHDIVNLFPSRLPAQDVSTINSNLTVIDKYVGYQYHTEVARRTHLPWDHIVNPGVVPRTFIGALLIGLPLKIAKHFIYNKFTDSNQQQVDDVDFTAQFVLQIGSRFALATFVVLSISTVTKAIHKRYGFTYRICYLMTTVSQFHYMFYAGRFLPNTYSVILSNLVLASWIKRQYSKAVIFIAASVLIFRFDTGLFYGILLIDAIIIRKQVSLFRVLQVGIPAGLLCIILTVSIDSFFWGRLVWPELYGAYYNIWLNKSSEWGSLPFFWYIYQCLPKVLMISSVLILLSEHKVTRDYMMPTLAFIVTFSFLPHKELRFVLFIVPFINMCIASGWTVVHYYIDNLLRHRRWLAGVIFSWLLFGTLGVNLGMSYVMSRASSHNYPGGQAALSLGMTKELLDMSINSLKEQKHSHLTDVRSDAAVYVDNLAAQTGLTRFVQVDGVYYSKAPVIDENTFRKSYKLIYFILEPMETNLFLKNFCDTAETRSENWKRNGNELRCGLPNQAPTMYCWIMDSVKMFQSLNMAGLVERLKQISDIQSVKSSLDDKSFIGLQTALHIIRCAERSKHNPFD